MVRNILGVIAGFFVGGIFVFLLEWIGHQVYPLPAGVDMTNTAAIVEYMKTAPLGAFLAVLVAQSAGSLFGGLITGLITIAKNTCAIIYGVLALIMAAINVFMIPSPIWFSVLALLLPIPLALLGSRVAGMFAKQS
jgi:hypothetical protein